MSRQLIAKPVAINPRIGRDLIALKKEEDFRVVHEIEYNRWIVEMKGPRATPWEKGIFQLDVEIPNSQNGEKFPTVPPIVKFNSKVFHPNVYENGNICLNILGRAEWSPTFQIHFLLISIRALLSCPNLQDPANPTAATLYASNSRAYHERVNECVQESIRMSIQNNNDDIDDDDDNNNNNNNNNNANNNHNDFAESSSSIVFSTKKRRSDRLSKSDIVQASITINENKKNKPMNHQIINDDNNKNNHKNKMIDDGKKNEYDEINQDRTINDDTDTDTNDNNNSSDQNNANDNHNESHETISSTAFSIKKRRDWSSKSEIVQGTSIMNKNKRKRQRQMNHQINNDNDNQENCENKNIDDGKKNDDREHEYDDMNDNTNDTDNDNKHQQQQKKKKNDKNENINLNNSTSSHHSSSISLSWYEGDTSAQPSPPCFSSTSQSMCCSSGCLYVDKFSQLEKRYHTLEQKVLELERTVQNVARQKEQAVEEYNNDTDTDPDDGSDDDESNEDEDDDDSEKEDENDDEDEDDDDFQKEDKMKKIDYVFRILQTKNMFMTRTQIAEEYQKTYPKVYRSWVKENKSKNPSQIEQRFERMVNNSISKLLRMGKLRCKRNPTVKRMQYRVKK